MDKITEITCPKCGTEIHVDITPKLIPHKSEYGGEVVGMKLTCGCGAGVCGSDLKKSEKSGENCDYGIWTAKCQRGHEVKIYV